MAFGEVTVTAGVERAISTSGVEGKCLIMVDDPAGVDQWIDQSTDIEALGLQKGYGDQLYVLKANAGSSFHGRLISYTGMTLSAALLAVLESVAGVEFIVDLTGSNDSGELGVLQSVLQNQYLMGNPLFLITSYKMLGGDKSWSDLLSTYNADLNDGTAMILDRIMVCPYIWGTEVPAFAGRLSRDPVFRTPMRRLSGGVVDPGAWPLDMTADALPVDYATLKAFSNARFSTYQWYINDTGGLFFADGQTLADGGMKIEHRRVIDACVRDVRAVALMEMGNEQVNNSAGSQAALKTKLEAPLRRRYRLGQIQALDEDAVVIHWDGIDAVDIEINIRPLKILKKLTAHITMNVG